MRRRPISQFICQEDYPIADAPCGKLRGYVDGDVFTFRGIPYAKARRFHMSEPVPRWDGVRDALDYGCGCPEMTYSIQGKEPRMELLLAEQLWHFSEDCQNLNIWTKSIDPAAKKAVMVWFHGGGFAGGSATHLYSYNGWELCHNYDVVVVTVNHRLNMLGYLDLSGVSPGYENSANAGLSDLVASLQWVKENIAAFGGDPDNVTIFGQSGGGCKVTALMWTPAADGLYHKAIIQSGLFEHGFDQTDGAEIGRKTAEILGLDENTIHEIETMDYEVVAAAVKKAISVCGRKPFSGWGPKANAYYLGAPHNTALRPENRHIPIIAGSCVGEFEPFVTGCRTKWSETQKMTVVKDRYGDDAPAAKKLFREAYPELDWSYAAAVDSICRKPTLRFLDMRAARNAAPVFNYLFTFESPYKGGLIAQHNMEIPFVFHNARYVESCVKPDITDRLQEEMAGCWAQFAKTGDPNAAGLPHWPAYTIENGACLTFGDSTILKEHHDRELVSLADRHVRISPYNG